ncbi:MAG: hypothetical protein AB7P69_17875 [Candidatus Binatia bacterium]
MEKTPKTTTDEAFLERLRQSVPEVLEAEMDFEKAAIHILHAREKQGTLSRKNKHGGRSKVRTN